MINAANWSSPGEVFSTDACLCGCGGTSAREYFHAEFPEFILAQDLDINSDYCCCPQAVESSLAWPTFDSSL